MNSLIQFLTKKYNLLLLHIPNENSNDIDVVSSINPSKYITKLVEELAQKNFILINFLQEDVSESVQLHFYDLTEKMFYWVDILYDLNGIGYFGTKSKKILELKIFDDEFREFKQIFKKSFQLKRLLKFRLLISNKFVYLNLFSNKLYKLYNLLKLVVHKKESLFIGEKLLVIKDENYKLYADNINKVIHTSFYSYFKWKYYFRFYNWN